MYRKSVNKSRSARRFRGQVSHTKALNMKGLARGGFRL